MFNCEMCKYSTKKEITLKNHMNTKHGVHNCKNCSTQFKTSIELLKHISECQVSNDGNKFFCDECAFSCKSKKNLKKHKKSSHNEEITLKPPTKTCKEEECEICGDMFESEKDLCDHYTKKHESTITSNMKCAYGKCCR